MPIQIQYLETVSSVSLCCMLATNQTKILSMVLNYGLQLQLKGL